MGRLSYLIDREEILKNDQSNKDSGADLISSMVMGARQTIEQLTNALEGLSEKIDEVEGRLGQSVQAINIPDHATALSSLARQIADVKTAVGAIEIPKVPPFPRIPEPKEVDLSPIMAALQRLESKEIEFPELELSMPEQPKKSWEFEIERDNYGGISRVVAKEI